MRYAWNARRRSPRSFFGSRGGQWTFVGGALVVCFGACSGTEGAPPEPNEDPAPTCETLFGLPNKNTGLKPEECSPRCASCDTHDAYTPGDYTAADLEALRALSLINPMATLEASPYASPEDFPERPNMVCALTFEDSVNYSLETYPDAEAAAAARAFVTHEGACGACSSLADLAVYIEIPDLTTPVRQCGISHLSGDIDELTGCIAALGFTEACAQVWAYNTINTREECFDVCIAALNEPYHLEDGSPNACIQCDEDKSGPVFKGASGRTRRNSGLPTALCRPCAGVAQLAHRYSPD
jgi:hypothetical protein